MATGDSEVWQAWRRDQPSINSAHLGSALAANESGVRTAKQAMSAMAATASAIGAHCHGVVAWCDNA